MDKVEQHGCSAKDWEQIFIKAGVLAEELAAAKGCRAKATKIGRFFGPMPGREVPIQIKGRTGKAVLRVEEARAKERRYYFEVTLDEKTLPASTMASDAAAREPTEEDVQGTPATTDSLETEAELARPQQSQRTSATSSRQQRDPASGAATWTAPADGAPEAPESQAPVRQHGNQEDW